MAGEAYRLLRRRVIIASWVAVWVMVGALLLLARLSDADEPPRTSSAPPEDDPVAASVRLVRMTAAETAIEVSVTGREEFARLADSGFARLTDSSGVEHFMNTGTLDGRTMTVTFEGLATVTPGMALVEFQGTGLTNDPVDAMDEARVVHVALQPLAVELAPTGGTVERTEPGASATAEGGYGATVTSVVRDDEGVVVSGRLDGFTREEIQSLNLRGTRLVLGDGSASQMTSGGYGLGDGLTEFRINFRAPREAVLARLEFHVNAFVPPVLRSQVNAEVRARLDAFEARDEFVISVGLEP